MLRRVALLAGASLSVLVINSSLVLSDGYRQQYAAPRFEPNWIIESNNQFGVQYRQIHVDYLETLPGGIPFDAEKGWVPGVGVSLSVMQNLGMRNIYFNAQFSYYNGKTDYTDFGALQMKDPATIRDLDFRLGKGFDLHRSFMLTPFFGMGWHDWHRDLHQYDEVYRHAYYGAGLLLQATPHAGLVLSADALIGRTFNSEIVVSDIPGFAPGSTLPLGEAGMYKIGLSADYAITRSLHVNTGVEWSHFKYGASPLDPTGSYNEPESRTDNVVFKIGVGYAFGGRDPGPRLK